MKIHASMIIVVLYGFLLAGCAGSEAVSATQMTPTSLPSPIPMPSATLQLSPGAQGSPSPSPEPIRGCFWGATVEVWEDTNTDGVHDPAEPPLPDVQVITDYGEYHRLYREDRTGPDGVVILNGVSNICDLEKYSVRVVPPAGYIHATPQSVVDNGGALRFGLKPGSSAPTSSPVPTVAHASTIISTPTVTHTPTLVHTPTIAPTPTATPIPVGANFSNCDVLTRAQARTILGPLANDPFAVGYIGPGALRSGVCIYTGALNQADIAMLWFNGPAAARAYYEQQSGEGVSGVGDEARWDESLLALSLLRDTIVIIIRMHVPDSARDQAIQVGQIAVTRVP